MMIVYNGKVSLYCFFACQLISLLLILPNDFIKGCLVNHSWWLLPLCYLFINIIIYLSLEGFSYQVAVRAVFLGFAFSTGLFISVFAGPSWHVFGWYICFLSFFHFSEFMSIALTNPKTLSLESYILDHSREYAIAAVASWIEFFIEWYFFPGLKQQKLISIFGAFLCIGGEVLRKAAMFTAKSNFTHVVQSVQEEGHQLVTHGVYSYCRHPSYVGWFYWSIGTQLVVVNPICIVGYALASWKFFHDRVMGEEITLLNFFGEDYYQYQKKVPTGLPYIAGFKVEL